MSEAIYSTFGVTFLASPLGEGERTACRAVGRRGDRRRCLSRRSLRRRWKVRGSKRATRNCPENPSPLPPFRRERRPFSVQRVCVLPRTPLKKWNQLLLRLASNERYFPGLYCAVASALSHLDATREVDLKVLDGGISQTSRTLFRGWLTGFSKSVRLEFVTVDPSMFGKATLGPGESHMTYCRILLPHLLNVPRLIYLDCDVLVFRDLAQLFDLELAPGKVLAAARDSETLSLADDSPTIADAINLPREGAYFNCGVMLMNLDELRKQDFFERAVEFLNRKSAYRFWDQSAINFLLYGQIDELPEYWNRASWRFDAQQNNDLDCVLHYTTSAPWLGGTRRPSSGLV